MDSSRLHESKDGENAAADCFPLDEAAIALVAEGKRQIETIEANLQGALALYIRQRKLPGRWYVAENGKELRRVTERVPDETRVRLTP